MSIFFTVRPPVAAKSILEKKEEKKENESVNGENIHRGSSVLGKRSA